MESHTSSHPLRIVDTMSNEMEVTDDIENMTVEDATVAVAYAIETYGAPVWVAHVTKRVRDMVPARVKAELLINAKPSEGWRTAQDGKQDILAWAKDNIFELVTIKQLAEIGEVSEATARKIVADRPDIFIKREGRRYEVRDPQADRKADRQ